MTDSRKFLLNGDYPVDKIVFLAEGWFIASGVGGGAEDATFYSFEHGLSFTPLIDGSWSFDVQFTTSREMFHPETGLIPGRHFMKCYSTPSRVEFDFRNWVSGNNPSRPVYYRIYGFMPHDVSTEVSSAATSSMSSNSFVFNTENNYSKLALTGSVTLDSDGRGVVNHGLGFIPQVDVWKESGDIIEKMQTGFGVYVTNKRLIFAPVGPLMMTGKFHYRIYADEF